MYQNFRKKKNILLLLIHVFASDQRFVNNQSIHSMINMSNIVVCPPWLHILSFFAREGWKRKESLSLMKRCVFLIRPLWFLQSLKNCI